MPRSRQVKLVEITADPAQDTSQQLLPVNVVHGVDGGKAGDRFTPVPSSKPARVLKIQPGIARNQPIRFCIAEAANEIRLDLLTCEERVVNTCVVEPRHGSAIQPERARRDNEIRPLQAGVAHGGNLNPSPLQELLAQYFSPGWK